MAARSECARATLSRQVDLEPGYMGWRDGWDTEIFECMNVDCCHRKERCWQFSYDENLPTAG